MSRGNEKIVIFGISHQNFEQRYQQLNLHLSKITQFPWEIVGVDGKALGKQNSFLTLGHAANLSHGQIGCALGHCSAYERMHDLGLRAAVIIEDDIKLPDNFDIIVLEVLKKIRPGEVINLHNPMMEKSEFSSLKSEPILDMNLIYPMSPRSIRSASAYAISIEAARAILAHNTPVQKVADHWDYFYEMNYVRTFRILHPSPFRWLPLDSVIGYGGAKSVRDFMKRNKLIAFLVRFRRKLIFQQRLRNVRLVERASPIELE